MYFVQRNSAPQPNANLPVNNDHNQPPADPQDPFFDPLAIPIPEEDSDDSSLPNPDPLRRLNHTNASRPPLPPGLHSETSIYENHNHRRHIRTEQGLPPDDDSTTTDIITAQDYETELHGMRYNREIDSDYSDGTTLSTTHPSILIDQHTFGTQEHKLTTAHYSRYRELGGTLPRYTFRTDYANCHPTEQMWRDPGYRRMFESCHPRVSSYREAVRVWEHYESRGMQRPTTFTTHSIPKTTPPAYYRNRDASAPWPTDQHPANDPQADAAHARTLNEIFQTRRQLQQQATTDAPGNPFYPTVTPPRTGPTARTSTASTRSYQIVQTDIHRPVLIRPTINTGDTEQLRAHKAAIRRWITDGTVRTLPTQESTTEHIQWLQNWATAHYSRPAIASTRESDQSFNLWVVIPGPHHSTETEPHLGTHLGQQILRFLHEPPDEPDEVTMAWLDPAQRRRMPQITHIYIPLPGQRNLHATPNPLLSSPDSLETLLEHFAPDHPIFDPESSYWYPTTRGPNETIMDQIQEDPQRRREFQQYDRHRQLPGNPPPHHAEADTSTVGTREGQLATTNTDDHSNQTRLRTTHTTATPHSPMRTQPLTAILDSGAQTTTSPAHVIQSSDYAVNIRPAPPGTGVIYGNNEAEAIHDVTDVGLFEVQLTPAHCSQSLISVDQIVSMGHQVIFEDGGVIIIDVENRYRLTYPRDPASQEWEIPLQSLADISKLRERFPATEKDHTTAGTPPQTTRRADKRKRSTSPHYTTNNDEDRTKTKGQPKPILTDPNRTRNTARQDQGNLSTTTDAATTRQTQPWSPTEQNNTTPINMTYTSPPAPRAEPSPPDNIEYPPKDKPPIQSSQRTKTKQIQLSHIFSGRLYNVPANTIQRVTRLHKRMGHAPCDKMCAAIAGPTALWTNTSLTPKEVRRVFRHQPCLVCVLSKRRKGSTAQWMTDNKRKHFRFQQPTINEIDTQNTKDRARYKPGALLSCDNIGPINPTALNGYTQFFLFRDTHTKMLFSFPVTNADSETFIACLDTVRKYFLNHGYTVQTVRSDSLRSLHSSATDRYYLDNNITPQASTPYQHWQNAVERDVQTLVNNVCATIHGTELLRADAWAHAVQHWTQLHNDTPHSIDTPAPNAIMERDHKVDSKTKYRFAFGDLVCFPLEEHERKWKFDTRNEIGFYVGDQPTSKGAAMVYQPYHHSILVRGDVHRVRISDVQLLQFFGRRVAIREGSLPFKIVNEAIIDLLRDKPYQRHSSPVSEENAGTQLGNPNDTIVLPLPINTQPKPTERSLRPRTHGSYAEQFRRSNSISSIRRHTRNIEELTAASTSDNKEDEEPTILHNYRMLSIHDSDAIAPMDLDDQENISTRDALLAHDSPLFATAIKSEIATLLTETKTLIPVGRDYVDSLERKLIIGTTVKCKRKKRENGQPDKHKARGAARGDQLARQYQKLGMPAPKTFSPTIKPLTFAFILQLAIQQNLIMATMDIKSAYLAVPIPSTEIPIFTKLETFVSELCGLDKNQYYQLNKYLYGLPDSGRAFYFHYRDALVSEGYTMSKYDSCLFHKVTPSETTYIIVFVDDTFIFSNTQPNMQRFIDSLSQHYTVTLDTVADSFLGLNIQHDADNSVLFTQPKLLKKLFQEFPALPSGPRTKKPRHPYGPAPTHDQATNNDTTSTPQTQYLRLLGLLMYLTKSRPDIMTAVSFGASKSHNPTTTDYDDLYHIVEYLRATPERGFRIFSSHTSEIQFYCNVDASYLTHPDSKGHTGYNIGIHPDGPFYNRSAKQALVSTSSTHAEMRACYTLVKDILFLFYICDEINVTLKLPAIIMEDNSAVITISNDETGYLKKCKHFLMLINYVKEQVNLGLIALHKVNGKINNSDTLTKKLRDNSFAPKTDSIMGLTGTQYASTPQDNTTPQDALLSQPAPLLRPTCTTTCVRVPAVIQPPLNHGLAT